jgi:ATP-binding cassette subfamily B protein
MLALLSILVSAWHRSLYVQVSGEVLFELRERVYAHLLKVSPRKLQLRAVGDLVSRLDGDIAEVQRFGTDSVASAANGLLGVLVSLVVMFTLSWKLTIPVLLLLPLQWLIRHYTRHRIESSTRIVRERSADVGSFLVSTLNGVRGVVGAAAERRESERLQGLHRKYLSAVLQQQLLGIAIGGGSALAGHAVTALLFLVGGWYVIHGNLSLGTLIAFITYFGRGAGSTGSVLALYTGYQRAKVSLGRVEELLSLPSICESVNPKRLGEEGGRIDFDAVSVLQTDGKPILSGLTFSVIGGTKLRLAGPSGVGKTTVIDLLRRFIDADSGAILIDGIPVGEYRLDDLRRRIAVLEQVPMIIPGTVWENLTYGVQAPDDAQVLRSAREAGVEEFISHHPDGYNTVLGERGAGLSSGQAQRIAMARLLQGNPLIVVLDEATNAIDREGRQALEALVDQCFCNRTRIVISHAGEHAADEVTVHLGPERGQYGA